MALVLIEETFEVVSGVVLSNFYNVGQILHARSYPEQNAKSSEDILSVACSL